MADTVLCADHLTYVYRNRRRPEVVASDDLSFEVGAGEVFGLLGPNGAGKTTLVRQLAGLLRPEQGRVALFGLDLAERPRWAAENIAYMSQRPAAIADLTPLEAIAVTGRLRGMAASEAGAAAGALVEELDLGGVAGRRIGRLSGGEARLAALGTTLIGERPLLVLDEPTAELDPINRRRVWEALRRRQAEQATTIVLVTHNVAEAETVFDRVVIMDRGRFLLTGAAAEVKARLADRVRVEMVVPADGDPAPDLGDAVTDVRPYGRRRYVGWGDKSRAGAIFSVLSSSGLDDYSVGTATLEDLFRLVGGEGELVA